MEMTVSEAIFAYLAIADEKQQSRNESIGHLKAYEKLTPDQLLRMAEEIGLPAITDRDRAKQVWETREEAKRLNIVCKQTSGNYS